MTEPLTYLRRLTETVLDVSRPFYSLRDEVLEIKSIFEKASGRQFGNAHADIADGEIQTKGGVAISPTMAAMCIDDFGRTVQFIRGLNSAIHLMRLKDDSRRVRVLYAGCGPWATLAAPIMSVWSPDDVTFTLLDIHDESINSTKRMIQEVGLSRHVERFVVDDALSYKINQSTPPDIVVVEMLRAALADEPQVAVAANLIEQCPGALMIPESVRIDVALVNRAKEFETDRDRIDLGTALILDRGELQTHQVWIPDYDATRYSPMLLTTIRVNAEHILRDYDSGVTCPRHLKSDDGPGVFEFFYKAGRAPRLSVRRVS